MKFEVFGYNIEVSKKLQSNEALPADLQEAIAVLEKYGKKIGSSEAQKKAAAKATATREQKAKEKIQNAINLLRMENKNLSNYAIAKTSGCSINTVKKYRNFINSQRSSKWKKMKY